MTKITEIIVVLDRSGSMDEIKQATIEGFNGFLAEQKAIEGIALLTLVQFDHDYEVVHSGKNLREVAPMSDSTYMPRGTTALLDAIGRTIEETRDRIHLLKDEGIDRKVVFVIITDGEENSSKEYNRRQIFDMIRRGEDQYNWQFVFLGANQDAIQEASRLGVMESRSMTFAADGDGAKNMYFDLIVNIGELRMQEKDFEFKSNQRKKQKR